MPEITYSLFNSMYNAIYNYFINCIKSTTWLFVTTKQAQVSSTLHAKCNVAAICQVLKSPDTNSLAVESANRRTLQPSLPRNCPIRKHINHRTTPKNENT